MFTIDLTLKNSSLPLSVQRKDAADAEALYRHLLEAMRSQDSSLVELSCERQPDKKIGVLSDQISAVVVSPQSGPSTQNRAPGFFAASEAQSA